MGAITGVLVAFETLRGHVNLFQLAEANASADTINGLAVKFVIEFGRLTRQEVYARKSEDIPIAVVLKTVEVLSQDSIQFCDELKYKLSRVARIFTELVLLECRIKERNVYPSTRTRLLDQIREVGRRVPKDQLATYYELERCKEAVRAIEPGVGKWREVRNDHAVPVVVGFAQAILSVGPIPSAAPAAALVEPLTQLGIRIYHELGATWYKDLLAIEIDMQKVTTLDEFKSPDLEKKIEEIPQHSDAPILAFGLGEMLIDLFDRSQDMALKKRVIINVLPLMKISKTAIFKGKRKDKFWKVRYRSLEQVSSRMDKIDNDLYVRIAEAIIKRLFHERYEPVAAFVRYTYQNLASKYEAQFEKAIASIDAEKEKQEAKAGNLDRIDKIRIEKATKQGVVEELKGYRGWWGLSKQAGTSQEDHVQENSEEKNEKEIKQLEMEISSLEQLEQEEVRELEVLASSWDVLKSLQTKEAPKEREDGFSN